jgi:non-specific serine/threonine protein kinase/serine/threonine-protein kinase
MNQRRLTKLQIFTAAAEEDDPLQRAHLLRELCGDDSELKREIEELLARELELGSFLESLPAELQRMPSETNQTANLDGDFAEKSNNTGRFIGPYKLIQAIGEGGMGEVWVAEQSEPVKRQVALKLMKGGSGSKEILARFDVERQALALMNHPNIARILDAGTTDEGQPYFVMEWVAGKPLTTYCDEIARPPSWNYRIQKFVSKNRVGVGAVTMIALALLCGIAASSWGMLWAWNAE